MYKFEYTKNAARDIRHLDEQIAKRILKKMDFFSKQENPLKFAKELKDSSLGEYRFRIGDYRVLFDVDESGNVKILMILSIKHRREAYFMFVFAFFRSGKQFSFVWKATGIHARPLS